MPSRFTITVSDRVTRMIRLLAEARGDKPTAIAAYELTVRMEEKREEGIYIDPGAEAIDSAAEMLGVDKDALSEFVRSQTNKD